MIETVQTLWGTEQEADVGHTQKNNSILVISTVRLKTITFLLWLNSVSLSYTCRRSDTQNTVF